MSPACSRRAAPHLRSLFAFVLDCPTVHLSAFALILISLVFPVISQDHFKTSFARLIRSPDISAYGFLSRWSTPGGVGSRWAIAIPHQNKRIDEVIRFLGRNLNA